MDDDGIDIVPLEERWSESTDGPHPLIETDEPPVQAGSYVIEPGERVPAEGTTSHAGRELSVILSGEIVLGGPAMDDEQTVESNTFISIPPEVEHYSRNESDRAVKLVYVVLGTL